jgi:hypothetical protein
VCVQGEYSAPGLCEVVLFGTSPSSGTQCCPVSVSQSVDVMAAASCAAEVNKIGLQVSPCSWLGYLDKQEQEHATGYRANDVQIQLHECSCGVPLGEVGPLNPKHECSSGVPLGEGGPLNPKHECSCSVPLDEGGPLNPKHECSCSVPLGEGGPLNPKHESSCGVPLDEAGGTQPCSSPSPWR